MRFLNFDLRSPNNTVELQSRGLNWDLHNFADFEGLRLEPDGSAVLTWTVPKRPNSWGDANNRYHGCELRFRDVRGLRVSGRDSTVPNSENRTLHDISKVTPEAGEYRQRQDWAPDAPFHLLLTFASGLTIEVDATEAELHPLQDGA